MTELETTTLDPAVAASGSNSGSQTPSDRSPRASSNAPLRVGEVVGGRYKILGSIDRGGMATVYRASHVLLPRVFALKVESRCDETRSDRLLNEARILGALSHPNLPKVFDFGPVEDGRYFIAMELVRAASLRHELQKHGMIEVPLAIDWMTQLLDALSYVHSRGIVHRDVKPSNCLLEKGKDGRWRVVLIDFGIAVGVGREHAHLHTRQQAFLAGTPRYMAPEQHELRSIDHRVDIFACGVILAELTASTWQDGNRHDQSSTLKPGKNAAFGPELGTSTLSGDFRQTVERALAAEPDARFATAAAFSAALHAHREFSETAKVAQASLAREPHFVAYLHQAVKDQWVVRTLEVALARHPLIDVPIRVFGSPNLDLAPASAFAYFQKAIKPESAGIMEVFAATQGSLLILGEPGAGKTIWLLRLVDALLRRREHEPSSPLPAPVVLPLYSWRREANLLVWMSRELARRYGLSQKMAQHLLATGALLPCLDGLDEVPLPFRGGCIAAINDYLRVAPFMQCVVSCRSADYQANLPRLALLHTVVLEPLSLDDARIFLASYPVARATFGQIVEEVETAAFVATPLALRLLSQLSAESWWQGGDRQNPLVAIVRAYVEGCLNATSPQALVNPRRELQWLAAAMTRAGVQSFDFDHLQPSWLTRKFGYVFASRSITAMLFGLGFAFGFGATPIDNWGLQVGPAFGAAFGLATALMTASVYTWLTWQRFASPSSKPTSLWRLGPVATLLIASGVAVALVGVFGPGMLVMAIEVGLFSVLVFGARTARCTPEADIELFESRRWDAHPNPLKVAITGLIGLLGGGLMTWLESPAAGLSAGGACACAAYILSSFRQSAPPTLQTQEYRAINKLMQRASLAGLLTAVVVAMPTALGYGPGYAAALGLNIGILAWLMCGGIDVIHHMVLRVALKVERRGQPDLPTLLAEALRRRLLRRVGWGYAFTHALVQDYLAATKAPGEASTTTRPLHTDSIGHGFR